METIRHMVLQFDPRQRSLPDILGVQHAELAHVPLRDIHLNDDVSIIFVAFSPRLVSLSGHEHRFAKAAVRVPDLALTVFSV